MKILWITIAFFLLGTITIGLSARATGPPEIHIESYCVEGDCPIDDYVLTGFRQTEPVVVFVYYAQDAPFGSQVGALTRAVQDWSSATTSTTVTGYAQAGGLPANSLCGGHGAPVPNGLDGRNTITWGPIDGLTIGRACWSSADECDVVLDSGWAGFVSEETTSAVALHEVGHCLGLGHSAVAEAVMYASYSQPKQLHADDIAGFCAIYGCTGEGTPTPPPPTPTGTATSTSTPTTPPTPLVKRCGARLVLYQWSCAFIPGIARDQKELE